jgi:dTDP-4-dehydrorhamnose 3,5-epimerase-like enzyme
MNEISDLVNEGFCTIAEDVKFLGPNIRVGSHVTIEQGVYIADGVNIQYGAVVKANSFVLESVPAYSIVNGRPSKLIGFRPRGSHTAESTTILTPVPISDFCNYDTGTTQLPLPTCFAYTFKDHCDDRGSLIPFELSSNFPFLPQRTFIVKNVPPHAKRGLHAHKYCSQFLICLSGSVNALIDDGHNSYALLLDKPNMGLFLPPLIWGCQYSYSKDSVLLVFASHSYDEHDYIGCYEEFIQTIK